jgi:arylsulfatase A-like enzyme
MKLEDEGGAKPPTQHAVARREFLMTSPAGVAGASLSSSAVGKAPKGKLPARPNILYIHSHHTGRYVSPYGHVVPTPNLQRLAGQGIVFRPAFCAGPTCSPSRASLLRGMCPHSNGMLGLVGYGFSLNDYTQHILHTLRKVGYYSAGGGEPWR